MKKIIMEIKAVKFYKNGFMKQPFAFGGEEGPEKFDSSVNYRSCLQNYLIDTGKEVILQVYRKSKHSLFLFLP